MPLPTSPHSPRRILVHALVRDLLTHFRGRFCAAEEFRRGAAIAWGFMATWWVQLVNQSRTNRIIRTSEKKPSLPPSKVFYGHCAKLGAASWNNYPHGTCLTAQVTRIEGFHWKTAPPCCGETSYLLRAKKYQPHRTQTDRI